MFKLKKKKRQIKNNSNPTPLSSVGFYQAEIIEYFGSLETKHPTEDQWLKAKITDFCEKRLSTGLVPVLEELYGTTGDAYSRKLLARKIYNLQQDYLKSFKEYSDRRLIMLAERENLFDKWEGVFILGCFGGDDARKYLEEKLIAENEPVLIQAMQRAVIKIQKNKEKKKKERGF